MTAPSQAPFFNGTFPHNWQAEILPSRPLILPQRHFVYPRQAEEVERGALEVLVRPAPAHLDMRRSDVLKGHDFSRAANEPQSIRALAPEGSSSENSLGAPGPSHLGTGGVDPSIPSISPPQEFLATCALGFRDPVVPTGLWSTPNPDELCAVSGGYAYLINTTAPERFTMIEYRPVLKILPAPAVGLLLFVGHHSILAWGANGKAWQSEKLSDEGVTLEDLDGPILRGLGWNMRTDKETPFALDLQTGRLIPPVR
jgi:hypothetical protein